MSRFLYKYMPLRLGFFKNPMVRATPFITLNDPFEAAFNKIQVSDADRNQGNFYRRNGKDIDESEEWQIDQLMEGIDSEFRDLGVISFAEDYNNLLMWSHYADEHKGCVVEFDFKKPFFEDSIRDIDGRKCRFKESFLGDCFEFPRKVDYRRIMPRFDRPELSEPDTETQYHWDKFNKAILFTKGNDWIYEKEQRSIVQLKDADVIICDENEYIRKLCKENRGVKIKKINNKRIQISYPREYEMNEEMGDESVKDEIYRLSLSSDEFPIHLFKINPKCISGVFFGCRSKDESSILDIRNNDELKHVKNIFRMSVSDERYDLEYLRK